MAVLNGIKISISDDANSTNGTVDMTSKAGGAFTLRACNEVNTTIRPVALDKITNDIVMGPVFDGQYIIQSNLSAKLLGGSAGKLSVKEKLKDLPVRGKLKSCY